MLNISALLYAGNPRYKFGQPSFYFEVVMGGTVDKTW